MVGHVTLPKILKINLCGKPAYLIETIGRGYVDLEQRGGDIHSTMNILLHIFA